MTDKKYYNEVKEYCSEHIEEYKALIKKITSIPAPSHKEERREKYLLGLLSEMGIKSHSDIAKNIVIDEFYTGEDTYLYMAHTDTVFPDEKEIKVIEEEGKIKAPGVGDDTANVAALIMTLGFIKKNNIKPDRSLLFVLDSCEEGLGNLKGCKQIFCDYGENITQTISFDLGYDRIVNKAVGSCRYEIGIKTEGGHSFNKFGNKNAIEYISKLVTEIYSVDVRNMAGKNTYNVGLINGGTSVNTIAEEAGILFEYRSDSEEGLKTLKNTFENLFYEFKNKNHEIEFKMEILGERPSERNVDKTAQEKLTCMGKEIIELVTGKNAESCSGSTDCNIPLSRGIPAICYGTHIGAGYHTRDEYIEISSLEDGLVIAMLTVLQEFKNNKAV